MNKLKSVVDSEQLSSLKLEGYKSIAKCELDLSTLNVLIGANGAGKSNFISFFKLIRSILDEDLQTSVSEQGGPDALLHYGRKQTEVLSAQLRFGNNGYDFNLKPTQDNRMMFAHEALWWNGRGNWREKSGHFESYAEGQRGRTAIYGFVVPAMRSWLVYHFHDTSARAKVKQLHGINNNLLLKEDASNLAAFLYRLKQEHEPHYKRIVKVVQLVAPFFSDFLLRPSVGNNDFIQLEWVERNQDTPFNASALSDGTLRFICLATVLLQPDEFCPATILIDEPELGLHPYAVTVLGSLIRGTSESH